MSNWGRKFRRAKDRKLGLGRGQAGRPCPGCKGTMARIGCRNMVCAESVDHTYDIVERARRRILGLPAYTSRLDGWSVPSWAQNDPATMQGLQRGLARQQQAIDDGKFLTWDAPPPSATFDYWEAQKTLRQLNNEESQRITKPKGKRDKGKQAWTRLNNL